MLRVQKHRIPEEWSNESRGISNRFLPLDPGDEVILDELAGTSTESRAEQLGPGASVFDSSASNVYGGGVGEGPPAAAYGPGGGRSEDGRKWSKRSEAAKKRWADPEYRAKMLAKRQEKRRQDAEAGLIVEGKAKVEIGRLDSITLSGEEKAAAINAYARSNTRRSEKLMRFHRDERTWMENRLSEGEKLRFSGSEEFKKARQEQRQAAARKRHARARARAEQAERGAETEAERGAETEAERDFECTGGDPEALGNEEPAVAITPAANGRRPRPEYKTGQGVAASRTRRAKRGRPRKTEVPHIDKS